MTPRMVAWVSLGLVVLSAAAAAEEPWETVQTEPIVVKTRKRNGSDIKEVWAEGTLSACPVDIQSTLTDIDRYPKFMPYIAEARYVAKTDPDGAQYVYSRLNLPILSSRDFVHKTYVDRDARSDPEGTFANHWFAVPDKLPHRHDIIRLQISEGSWLVTPLPDGKSHVVYHVTVDPGGAIPSWAANKTNADGVSQTFKNIEHESQKRAAERASSGTH
jgi:hypothetical protein